METLKSLEKALCKELETIDQKLKGGKDMTDQDLERLDKITHAMKSIKTIEAMEEAEEYEAGMSGRRGRSPSTGRYVSRDEASYAEGWGHGYSEGMRNAQTYPAVQWR